MKKTILSLITILLSTSVFAQKWTEETKITSDNREAWNQYGSDFDIQNGVLFTADKLTNSGQVLIKEQNSIGSWITKQTLIPFSPSAENPFWTDNFGSAIAVSGKYLVVGADKSDSTASNLGLVNVYEEKNGEWDFLQTITSPNPTEEDYFGAEVAINSNVIVISRPEYISNSGQGSVFVYELEDSLFVFKQKLNGSGIEDWDLFGDNIAVNADFIVASSGLESQYERTSQDGDLTGGAYIFKKDSIGTWTETQHLLPPNRRTGGFYGDGLFLGDSTMFIGSPRDGFDSDEENYLSEAGAVYEYKLSSEGSWEYISKVTTFSRTANANFGSSITYCENRLAVSAPRDKNLNGKKTGRVYSFLNNSNAWTFDSYIESNNSNENDLFGNTIKAEKTDLFIGSNNHGFDNDMNEELISSGAIFHFNKPQNIVSSKNIQYKSKTILFPNPSNGVVFIDLNEKLSSGTYNVVDICGKEVIKDSFYDTDKLEIKLGNVQGVFFVEIKGNNNLISVHRFFNTK